VCVLVEATGGVAVLSPGALGILPDAHPQNMGVMGSKGSLSGNFATSQADLLIVIGSRGVCQADCSGTGYASADAVININADLGDVTHYNRTVALAGDIGVVVSQLLEALQKEGGADPVRAKAWLGATAAKKREWEALKASGSPPGPPR
jgi:3D-(3,5/4)-trihydroxycyclohexane-1,2-dione acylhydrolase (decyclizing)